ncbi:MAG TPA: bifunctional DNA-formamidopyrimidine glycosylase/DNA-(apurinic or apyrimidinic site) lyase [Candidatus Obscuribacterales bacterium]
MPEMPEVEIVRRGLEAQLKGAEIARLEIRTPSVVIASPEQLDGLVGQKLEGFGRRAKYLILELSRDRILIHLRMTGQLLVVPPGRAEQDLLPLPFTYYQRPLIGPDDKHVHGVFHFRDGTRLLYRDQRKFGRVQVLSPAELAASPGLARLGPEPLTPEFTLPDFRARLKKTQRPIKAFLLDQAQVAGLGNIYVDEALFVARIRPNRPASGLKPAENKRLFEAIPFVLQKGIDAGGTSLRDYLHPDGTRGEHQEHLYVYGRGGQPCLECGAELVKTVLAQRGTHYCPSCQS